MNFKEDLRKHFNILLTNEQLEMFEIYYKTLIEYNKHTNLTRIVYKEDVYYKHFYDSLTLSNHIFNEEASLLDMGSGAGFPSIPLKIIYPNLKVTIVDSSKKRINFLKELTTKLKLKDIKLFHDRIEVFAHKNLNKYDYVTARALGHLNLITEYAIPTLKVGGRFLAMKSLNVNNEINESDNAFKVLHAQIINQINSELPNDYGNRTILIIEKKKHINGYPRKYSKMIKKPL